VVHVRPWRARDRPSVANIDTTFRTRAIFEVSADDACFCLREQQLDEPLTKSYPVGDPENPAGAFVAERNGRVVGYAELIVESWNGRGTIRHLYVTAGHRGRGVGSALLARVESAARDAGARTLWIETQNVNYPAVQFYRHVGFKFAGLDLSLYGPGSGAGEVALFFSRDL
jgi:ribosomal protein S18 acetylase RimI-like enzyme